MTKGEYESTQVTEEGFRRNLQDYFEDLVYMIPHPDFPYPELCFPFP